MGPCVGYGPAAASPRRSGGLAPSILRLRVQQWPAGRRRVRTLGCGAFFPVPYELLLFPLAGPWRSSSSKYISPRTSEPHRDWSEEHPLLGQWSVHREDNGRPIRALINTEHIESFLDDVGEEFGSSDEFRIVMLPVEATVPRERDEPDEVEESGSTSRVSREELYADVAEPVHGTASYFTLVVLSTIVAAG